MKKSKIILALIFILGILSCEQESSSYRSEVYSDSADSLETIDVSTEEFENENIPISSTAATYQDDKRKFVRTADLSMDVKNVYKSTTNIEANTAILGGFVAQSNLESRVLSNKSYPLNNDSAKLVKKYQVSNLMTLRIPQQELGTFLLSLGEEMEFLNYRNISADDVSISLILNELEQNRKSTTNQKLGELAKENGKITHKQRVIDQIDQNEELKNSHKANQLTINDKIEFSTIDLLISESPKVYESKVVNLKTYDDKYQPGLLSSAWLSIKGGWGLFQNLLTGLLYLWPIILLGGLVYLLIKNWKTNKKAIG